MTKKKPVAKKPKASTSKKNAALPAHGERSSAPCAMCVDPQSNKDIEAYIRGEMRNVDIAKKYAMRSQDVERHIHRHMATALRPAMRRIMLNPDVTKGLMEAKTEAAFILADKMAALSDRLDRLLASEHGEEPCPACEAIQFNPKYQNSIAALSKALLGYLHELGVWTGDIKSTILNINVQQNYLVFKNVVLEVLEEHPDVLEKVQARLADLPQESMN